MSVKNIALKVKNLMWGVWAVEVIIAWMNQMTGDGQAVVLITASLLLTIIMTIYVIVRGTEEKSEALIDEVIDYIRNIYPLERIKQQKGNIIAHGNTISLEEHKEKKAGKALVKEQVLENRNNKDEQENVQQISGNETAACEKTSKELNAKDIAKLLDWL